MADKIVDVDFVAVGRGKKCWRIKLAEHHITYSTLAAETFKRGALGSGYFIFSEIEEDGTVRIFVDPGRRVGTIIVGDYHGQGIED